jgi:hypothetical protein
LKWVWGAPTRWSDKGLIIDYMEAMELAAGRAWEDARAAGKSPDSDRFYHGFLVALKEFFENQEPPDSLEGSSPFEKGRKQAWAILSAMSLSVSIGFALPPVVLPEVSGQDREFAPGWIGSLGSTAIREGIFEACDTLVFRWLAAGESPRGGAGGLQSIVWKDVNRVRLVSLSSLVPGVAAEILGDSGDLKLVHGTLIGPDDPRSEAFGLVGTVAFASDAWLGVFKAAGVKILASR